MSQDALWYKDAIFYELYVRAFADGNGDGHGDFRGLVERLDYLHELGVDCIWLLPCYPSPLRDDGYDIADFTAIHPDYGTLDDFKVVLDAAHQRRMRVITDLVMNHTSDQHPWFQEARASKDSPRRDYYVWSDTDQRYRETRIIFLDSEPSNWTWDEVAGQYFWHRFYAHQPDLNYDNPQVQQAMLDVVRFWLELGVDGFRADAVPYLFEREGTNCENLPETHAYLKRVRDYVETYYPGRILLAEANQLPQDLVAYFGDGDEFHMGFHFAVMPRLYIALKRADRSPIVDILQRTPPIPDTCQWCIFLRNHDELTLEMVSPEEREFMWRAYAPEARMRLNLGIRRRLAPLLDNDRRKIELLNSLLFTLPGSPIIYYGDEIGMGDDISLPDRNGVRTPMQWSARANAGFSTAQAERLYSPLIAEGEYAYTRVNVQAQLAEPGSLLNTLKHMIRVRKGHAGFGRGSFEWLSARQGEVAPANRAVLAYVRRHQAETLLVVHNLSDMPQRISLDLSPWSGSAPRDLLAGRELPAVGAAPYALELGAYGYVWLGI